jgi:acetyltransferase-like isoleucine patch superfamily enzyme
VLQLQITDALLDALYQRTILLRFNSPPPAPGGLYGWARANTPVVLHTDSLRIEQNSGLYVGPYKGLVGSRRASGFASSGSFSYSYSMLPEGFAMGRYCSISSGLRFLDSTHPLETVTTSAITFRPRNKLFERFITPGLAEFAGAFNVLGTKAYPTLGHDVWIGADVTLAMGIRIGTGAIVASGSVVTRDVPPYAIVAGNPATIKKQRFAEELGARLIDSAWWNLTPAFVFNHEFTDPSRLCDRIEKDRSSIDPFVPGILDFAAFIELCGQGIAVESTPPES